MNQLNEYRYLLAGHTMSVSFLKYFSTFENLTTHTFFMRYFLFLLAFAAATAVQGQSAVDFSRSYAVNTGSTSYASVINVIIANNKISIFYNPIDTTVTDAIDSSIVLNNMSKEVISAYISTALDKRFNAKPGGESAGIAELKTANQVADDYMAFVNGLKAEATLVKKQTEAARALDGIDSLYEKAFFVRLNILDKNNLVPLTLMDVPKKKKGDAAPPNTAAGYIQVERVTLGFSNWNLGNVVVYGKVKSTGSLAYDSSITLNNIRVIPVSSRNMIAKIVNEPLKNTSGKYGVNLSQVISITPNDSLVFDLYVPQRTFMEFHVDEPELVQHAMKPSIASYFNYAIFGDLTGYIQDDAPNGKFQTEISAMLPLLVRPMRNYNRIPNVRSRRFSLFVGKSFAPEICLAKFGTDNRFLPVQYFTRIDTTLANTADDTTLIKHINNMDALQFANFWAGGRFNVFALEGKNPSWAIYFNFRFRYIKTELADTSRGFNKLPQVRSVSYEPEITFKRKISRNFYAEMGVSVNMLRLYSNAYELSFEKQYGDGRDSVFVVTPRIKFFNFVNLNKNENAFFNPDFRKQLIWTPQITLRYNPPSSPMSGAFVRIAYPFNSSQNNSFLIAQIGISKPVTNLLAKAKTAPSPSN